MPVEYKEFFAICLAGSVVLGICLAGIVLTWVNVTRKGF